MGDVTLSRGTRIKVVRKFLEKRRGRLRKSMASLPEGTAPRASVLAHWQKLRDEVAELEWVLAELLAGRDPPGSPRTGAIRGATPDRVGPLAEDG